MGCFEKRHRLADSHVQYLGNFSPLVVYFQCFTVKAFAVTDVAGNIDIWQKLHLDFDNAFSLAGLAATTFGIEREAISRIPPYSGIGRFGIQVANKGEQAGIGRGIGALAAAYGYWSM